MVVDRDPVIIIVVTKKQKTKRQKVKKTKIQKYKKKAIRQTDKNTKNTHLAGAPRAPEPSAGSRTRGP